MSKVKFHISTVVSVIGRDNSKNKEYSITVLCRNVTSQSNFTWNLFKKKKDFSSLDSQLRKVYKEQMLSIYSYSKKALHKHPTIPRKEQLNSYMYQVLACNIIEDCQFLREFLDVDKQIISNFPHLFFFEDVNNDNDNSKSKPKKKKKKKLEVKNYYTLFSGEILIDELKLDMKDFLILKIEKEENFIIELNFRLLNTKKREKKECILLQIEEAETLIRALQGNIAALENRRSQPHFNDIINENNAHVNSKYGKREKRGLLKRSFKKIKINNSNQSLFDSYQGLSSSKQRKHKQASHSASSRNNSSQIDQAVSNSNRSNLTSKSVLLQMLEKCEINKEYLTTPHNMEDESKMTDEEETHLRLDYEDTDDSFLSSSGKFHHFRTLNGSGGFSSQEDLKSKKLNGSHHRIIIVEPSTSTSSTSAHGGVEVVTKTFCVVEDNDDQQHCLLVDSDVTSED